MGDFFQIIVDKQASLDRAEALSQKMVAWLVNRGIILPTLKECVLSGDSMGYPPGPNFRDVVEIPVKRDPTQPEVQIVIDHDLHHLKINGMAVIQERTVFHSGQGDVEITCKHCQASYDHQSLKPWGDTVKEWFSELSEGLLTCPNCCNQESVIDWHYYPPWGFGNLGFKFWNWPPLLPSFVKEVEERLGNEVVFVYGKI